MDFLKNIELALLFDLYSPLLTKGQSEISRLILEKDYTLSEVAEVLKISRQAVLGTLKKAEVKLLGFEAKLGFLRERRLLKERLSSLKLNVKGSEVKLEIENILKEI